MSSISLSQLFKNLTSSLDTLGLVDTGLHGNLEDKIYPFLNLQKIDLARNINLTGYLSNFNWSNSLRVLDLSYTSFTEKLPHFIGHMKSLNELYLSSCQFVGKIPESFWNLTQLTVLDISNNSFSGQVSSSLSNLQNLYYLDLSSNGFKGHLPASLWNLTQIVILNLSHNNFTGTIPQCIGSSSLALSVFDLQMNSFSGTIPKSFEMGNNLRTLNLNGNLLEGSLPQSLVNFTKLKVLNLGKNRIEDTFPMWLQAFEELQVLVLRGNKLHGSIPIFKDKTSHAFPKLRVVDLSNNNLSGLLPVAFFKSFEAMKNVDEELGLHYMFYGNYSLKYEDSIKVTMKGLDIHLLKILTIFTTIDLSDNMFEGEIPQIIGELGALKGLIFSHNKLTGAIPSATRHLRSLEWLDLSSNSFVGKIPIELTNLNFLSFLNLSQNQLEGCIPRGQQFETFSSDSFKGNKGLCGSQLMIPCITHDERQPPLPSSSFKAGFEFGWKPVLLGYVCGVAFGALLFRVVIFTGKPQWIASMVNDPPKKRKGRVRNCHL